MPKTEQKQISYALASSLLLHGVFLTSYIPSKVPELKKKAPIEVELLKPKKLKPKKKKQIVSDSKAKEEKPKKETNLRSDKNQNTRLEQIKRGNPGQTKSSQAKKQAQKTQTKKEEIKKPKLLLDEKALEENFNKKTTKEEQNKEKLEEYKPFQRNFQDYTPRLGIPDFLPNIQDGEISLLNTKAERYAIFVRRVALQVFGALRRMSWQSLSSREIYNIRKHSTVRAIMNKKGELLSVELKTPSGSKRFDEILTAAAKNSAWDQNPPKGAESKDGNIHFLFKSKTWSRMANSGIGEERWLFMSAGLK